MALTIQFIFITNLLYILYYKFEKKKIKYWTTMRNNRNTVGDQFKPSHPRNLVNSV